MYQILVHELVSYLLLLSSSKIHGLEMSCGFEFLP
jgi:hypothetical protein